MEQTKTKKVNKNSNRSEDANKFLEGLEKVHKNLIEFKKKMKTELVYSIDGKIVRVKP
jgi:uncharacterized FlaG/YvyC family protein